MANIKEVFNTCLLRPGQNLCLEFGFVTHTGEEYRFRDPGWKNGYPATRLPEHKDYQASVGFLDDALHDEISRDGVLMIASPSQDNLVRVLSGDRNDCATRMAEKRARLCRCRRCAHSGASRRCLSPLGRSTFSLTPANRFHSVGHA